jgi:hypothetical protein
MSIATTSTKNRVAVVLAVLAFAFVLAVLWLKTGRVPAPSGSDEVWMGEGAHWLLKEGVHAYDFLADEHEHQVLSTFQPVSSLFYAAVFAVFGMSPFTLMLQAPVVGTVIMVLLVLVGRQLGFSRWITWLVPAAAWGLMMVERRLTIVRWEPLVAMWAVGAFYCLLRASQDEAGKQRIWLAAAGVITVLGGVSYYPHAPFVVLAMTGAVVLIFWAGNPLVLAGKTWPFALGGLTAGGFFLTWIARNYEYFHKQVVAFGDEHYLSLQTLAWPVASLLRPPNFQDWVALAEHAFVIAAALLAFFILRDAPSRATAWIAIVMSLPVFLYRKPIMDIAGGVFGVLVVALLARHWQGRWSGRLAALVLWGLAAVAVAKFALGGYTAYAQADRRSYALFEEKLRAALGPEHGKIASSQFTWLALREEKGRGEFNFISKYGDPSYSYRSTALRTREGVETHTHIIVAKGYEQMIRDHYPEMQTVLDDGTFVKVTEIIMPGPALPWAGAPIYDCTVYRNTTLLP